MTFKLVSLAALAVAFALSTAAFADSGSAKDSLNEAGANAKAATSHAGDAASTTWKKSKKKSKHAAGTAAGKASDAAGRAHNALNK